MLLKPHFRQRYGPGPNGYIRSIAKYMIQSGASFGFFMGIGTIIRTEGRNGIEYRRAVDVRIVDSAWSSDREKIERRLGVRA